MKRRIDPEIELNAIDRYVTGIGNNFTKIFLITTFLFNIYFIKTVIDFNNTPPVSNSAYSPLIPGEIEIEKGGENLSYKEIDLVSYTQINPKEFRDLSKLQLEIIHHRNRFEKHLQYNEEVFKRSHDFTGKDRAKYHEFRERKMILRAQLKDSHRDIFNKWLQEKVRF